MMKDSVVKYYAKLFSHLIPRYQFPLRLFMKAHVGLSVGISTASSGKDREFPIESLGSYKSGNSTVILYFSS